MSKLFVLCTALMCLRTYAGEISAISAEDERAYMGAYTAWQHQADINAEIGLPPFGEEPKRENFIGISKTQRIEADNAKFTEQTVKAQWQAQVEKASPYLRTLTHPNTQSPTDHRSTVARQEKGRLTCLADERWAKQNDIERQLDALASRLGVERKTRIGKDRFAILAGEMDGEPIWLISYNQFAAASISADELWPTNTVPWPSSSTGLGLTGTNITLGMWEVDGAVRESHYEFHGRVVQMTRTQPTLFP